MWQAYERGALVLPVPERFTPRFPFLLHHDLIWWRAEEIRAQIERMRGKEVPSKGNFEASLPDWKWRLVFALPLSRLISLGRLACQAFWHGVYAEDEWRQVERLSWTVPTLRLTLGTYSARLFIATRSPPFPR
jgi:hypothetical protein